VNINGLSHFSDANIRESFDKTNKKAKKIKFFMKKSCIKPIFVH